jgi:hypothetical protein
MAGQPINQPSLAPSAKVASGGLAGAFIVLVVWILGAFHVTVPPEVASALTVLFSSATSYLVRERVPVAADNTKAAES